MFVSLFFFLCYTFLNKYFQVGTPHWLTQDEIKVMTYYNTDVFPILCISCLFLSCVTINTPLSCVWHCPWLHDMLLYTFSFVSESHQEIICYHLSKAKDCFVSVCFCAIVCETLSVKINDSWIILWCVQRCFVSLCFETLCVCCMQQAWEKTWLDSDQVVWNWRHLYTLNNTGTYKWKELNNFIDLRGPSVFKI